MTIHSARILTVGTGAVGAIYSWRLSQSCNITAVCRSNYEVVKSNGFNIDSKKFGQAIFRPDHVVKTVSEAAAASEEPFDYILVTLKALPEVYNVAELIAPAVSPTTTIVLLQNGLGIEEPITTAFPKNPIVSIVAYIGTSQVEPGVIRMGGGESLVIGRYNAAPVDSEQQREKFIGLLEKGNVEVQKVDDVERVRWQKLFWNASFSPVCAITGMNTSELLRNENAVATVKNLISDVVRAACAMGYDFDVAEQTQIMLERTEKTAQNYKPSMQLDLERGSPMEVEVILGTAVRRAKEKGVDIPHLETIYNMASAINAHTMESKKSQL
ncbi:2-dehydropantoate 2-reductase [Radiomyces spectabilis]|uniref:2-dehydropantoate 2-reductase n=1 Tax=Radiomyces spectabilis TaxID=64574 RepID=UPI00222068E5|nr:2-dehydropantoate 2-reductase [Radiomyces spectabilis]KAI8370341.1 2-dehydropantoate 2-reductase [Radiomyces spectabilis]